MALAFPERSADALWGTVAAILRPLQDRGAIRLIDPRAGRISPIVRAVLIGPTLFATDANVRILNTKSCYRLCRTCGAVIVEA
jgi:hypothetical protein